MQGGQACVICICGAYEAMLFLALWTMKHVVDKLSKKGFVDCSSH